MKHLYFLLIIMFLLGAPKSIFAAEVGEKASEEQIETTKKKAETEQANLKTEQENLQKLIEQQKEVEKASGDREEAEKLSKMQAMDRGLESQIVPLSEYLNKVANNQEITQTDVDLTNLHVKDAQNIIKLSENLRNEFVPAEPSESQVEQEAQTEIEKLSLWDRFKLNVQSAFAQTKAALASFFGNTEAQIAAHKDLVDIYTALKDYGSQAKSAGKLAGLYAQLNNLGDAIKAQATQIETLNNPNITEDQKISAISETVADTIALKDELLKNPTLLTAEDRQPLEKIDAKVDDFLGELDYKISKVSAYEILGAQPTDTVEKIRENYDYLVMLYTAQEGDSEETKQRLQENLNNLNNAMKELFGSEYLNNPDLKIRAAYDKLPIVQQRFEITKMDTNEKEAFDQQKKQKATLTETDILSEEN